jgi:hypothetical protein
MLIDTQTVNTTANLCDCQTAIYNYTKVRLMLARPPQISMANQNKKVFPPLLPLHTEDRT